MMKIKSSFLDVRSVLFRRLQPYLTWTLFTHLAFCAALVLFTKDAARWTWTLFTPSVPAITTPLINSLAVAPSEPNVPSILRAGLFGRSPGDDADIATDGSVPVSSLNLLLSGVVVAGKGSIALVSASGRPPEPFVLGQEIIPGVKLDTVLPDRILVSHDSKIESLLLGGASAAGLTIVPRGGGDVRQTAAGKFEVSKEALSSQLKSGEFLSQASIVPSADGGLAVQSVQAGSVFEKLGLKAGQSIRAVNGKPIQSMDNVWGLYQKLGAGGRLQMDVIEDGQPRSLSYNVR